jgi:hypothetical protein
VSFIDEIRERARRASYGGDDSWYVSESQYILELRTKVFAPGVPSGFAFMVFPLGPEHYRVGREYRQSITPTVGGLIAEERGLLWKSISISGTFGLQSKTSPEISWGDNTGKPWTLGMSGPGWTRRMVRHFFDQYGKLKANHEFAADTHLIWHDNKTDDHWVVVPESVNIDRNVQRRMQYPYEIQLKATADAADFALSGLLVTPTTLLGKARNAIAAVNRALQDISSAIQEGSRILGEVRYFVATIDSVVDKLKIIVDSAQNFVDGVTATISIGAAFISSTQGLLQSMLDTMETITDLPSAVRQNYQRASDGLDTLLGEAGDAFARSYDEVTDPIADAEAGAASDSPTSLAAGAAAGAPSSAQELSTRRTRSTDLSDVESGALQQGRPFSNYTGSRIHILAATDTLPSLAGQFLGSGALWYDIALLNGLKAPYLTSTGAPSTLGPGDRIAIPTTSTTDQPFVVSDEAESKGRDTLGTDFMSVETPSSRPGRPKVDFAIDKRHYRDALVIGGPDNLAQALQLRTWTEQTTMPLIPTYGVSAVVGGKNMQSFAALVRVAYRAALQADPRVSRLSDLKLTTDGDVVDVDADIVPVGYDSAQAISVSIG